MSMLLEKKIAIVYGGAGAIGGAVARADKEGPDCFAPHIARGLRRHRQECILGQECDD